ncbi:bridge-like lipid transfer protein family member 2 isoform X2 [Apostichopus japonicus]|uniref:bridge-like lipid transfer protein family member 2 isoform X2 n=1 Tax=Stichopus japonicus TaxID=307972 RepID=UPI003AB3E81D
MAWMYIVISLAALIVILLALSRTIAIVLSKILTRIVKHDVSIDYIGFFSLKNIAVSFLDSSVVVDEIWLSWRIFNSKQKYPAALHIGDVRIRADAGVKCNTPPLPLPTEERSRQEQKQSSGSSGFLSPWVISLSKSVITLMSFHLEAVNVMFLNTVGEDSLLHISINKSHFEGSSQTSRKLTGNLSVGEGSVKVLSSTEAQSKQKKSFVLQASTSINAEVVLNLEDKLCDVASVSLTNTSVSIVDEFVTTLQKHLQSLPRRKKETSGARRDAKLQEVLQKIPGEIQLTLDKTDLSLTSGTGQRSLHLSLEHFQAKNSLTSEKQFVKISEIRDLLLPHMKTEINLKRMEVTTKSPKKLLYILDSDVAVQLSEEGLRSSIHFNSFHVHFPEDEIAFWVPKFSKIGESREDLVESEEEFQEAYDLPEAEREERASSILKTWLLPVTFDLALNNTSMQLTPRDSPSFLSELKLVKFEMFHTPGVEETLQETRGSADLQELLCRVGTGPFRSNPSFPHNSHIFGSPCSLEKSRLVFQILPDLHHTDLTVQSLQLETSPELIRFCKLLCKLFPSRKERARPTSSPVAKEVNEFEASFKMEDFSIFLTTNIPYSVIFHVDSLSAGTAAKQFGSEIEGTILQRFSKVSQTFSLSAIESTQGSSTLLNIREIDLKYNGCTNEFSCAIPDGFFSSWDTTSHMTLFHHSQELVQFGQETKAILSQPQSTDNQPEEPQTPSTLKSKFTDLDVSINVTFLQFSYQLSQAKRNSITVEEFLIRKEKEKSLKVTFPEAVFDFEGHEIITLKSACIEQLINNDHHLDVRKGYEQLELASNWGIGFYTSAIDVVFPWEYDFAENYNEIININKWLKKVHGKKRSSDNPPIYPDMVLRCQEFTLKIGDDPFEVKLGDNYELMKDERMESDRRQSLLDNKVEELKNQHGQLLPASKIEELYTSLEKKNLEIFVKRSQKLNSTTPMRKALLTLEITSIEINALCDTTMNGKENVIKHMKEIDHASRFPEGGLDFTTLWCRMVQGHLKSFDLKLRDYPQSLWVIKDMHWWGKLIGAEQVAKPRATREVPVEVQGVWGNDTVIRSMPPLKFFHDLATDVKEWRLAWGPSFEPAWAQINLCLNLLNKPSVDPSPPVPFWDKIRHLYHGRLVASVEQMNLYWLAMKNPYQTTELLDWEWKNCYIDWQNAHFLIKSDLDIFVRTASKYDDVRLLHLPNVKFEISLEWLCQGDPNDHHSVLVCAPDKIPEYSSNQTHDSYAAFRTYNLNLSLNLDIRGHKKGEPSERLPSCLFYSSTMRWLQNFQSRVLANVTRPTRKGKLFKNTNPRKLQLSRHYKFIELCASFPSMQVNYWASFAQRQGMELNLGKGSFKSKYSLTLEPIEDGLIHRPRANWSIIGLDFEVVDNEANLYTTDSGEEIFLLSKSSAQKHHLASLAKVVYARHQAKTPNHEMSDLEEESEEYETEATREDTSTGKEFIHKLIVHEFCGSWTRFNRDVFFSLYDSYGKAQTLKHNLSTEALKGIKVDTNPPSHKLPGVLSPQTSTAPSLGTPSSCSQTHSSLTPSPMTRLQGGHGANMLQQLLAETSTKFMVFSEESTKNNEQLYGLKACSTDDVIQHNWCIEFVNSQLMLKGLDFSGYVLVTAANAELMQKSHLPSWREQGKLASKTTWVGTLDGLQYFGTVDTPSDPSKDEVQWLQPSLIERGTQKMTDLPDMVGSGESVGGVVNDTVGPSAKDLSWESVQVQRIISRCGCQFFYALYGDDVDPEVAAQMLHSSKEMGDKDDEDNILDREEAVDSLTLIYHDLDICTNSTQYNMIVDTLNNLLLYVEPKRKEALARTQHMMFALQLSSIEDQKGPIMQLQNSLRNLISHLREVEKELYDVHWASEKAPNDQALAQKTRSLEIQLYEIKESMGNAAEDLRIMVSCFQEIQLQMALKRKLQNAQSLKTTRRVELCFGVAKWKLTESDGQLGTADMELRHFKYTRITRDDDSGDNIFELGYITINNLLANDVYKEVLRPQDPSGNQVVLRVITRGRPPVGGISVTEKFELSVVPLSIQLTYRFFKKMMVFFFPRHNVDQEGQEDALKALDDEDGVGSIRSTKSKRKQKNETDIDKMKERASRNTSFFYIKIPAVPLSVSYKGEKEKNIEDVSNFKLTLPSLEYHNCTWTWLDLLMAMKKEYKQAVLSQAIKEKLKFRIGHKEEGASGSETREDVDKAKLLMGDKLTTIPRDEKHSGRRTLFGKGQGGT